MGGVDIYTVKELMGHKDIKMTMRYAHLAPSHLQKAVCIHIVSSCHSRYRGVRQQRLFYYRPPLSLSSPAVLSYRCSNLV